MASLNPAYPWTTKLSSAGLVYAHFGHRIIAELLGTPEEVDSPLVRVTFRKVYENCVEEIDAMDNGINACDGEPRYKVCSTIGARVSALNPAWNEPDVDASARFQEAMALVGAYFEDRVRYFARRWWPARELVVRAVEQRFETDASGEIVRLDFCPWKEHLFEIERELSIEGSIKYVLYQDKASWRVQCVPVHLSSFENRVPLHAAWRGFRDEELSKLSGIPGCVFV